MGTGRPARCAPARSSCAAGRSTRRSSCSSPAWATRTSSRRSGSTSSTTCPGVGENLQDHLEVYIQYAEQAAGVRCSRRCRSGGGRGSASSGSSCAAARAPPTTSRAAASPASNDDVAYPNLMFHFLPLAIRYDGSAPAGGHGYQVHIGPMYSDARGSVKITSADPRGPPGPAVQLPVDRAGPARVGGGDPGRPAHPQPARLRAVQRRRDLARTRRSRRTSRSSTGWPGTRRPPSTRRAPAGWAPTSAPWWTPRACASTASTGCAWWTPR